MNAEATPRLLRCIERGLAEKRELGTQLYVSRAGESVCQIALGESRHGVPMRDDTLMFWISMTKPVMGVAFAQLFERGLVSLDDRVAVYLPGFAQGGKDDVTIRHLLTHTAGFREASPTWLPVRPFWEVVKTICAASQEGGWVAGEHSGYNVAAAWYVLAAVLERVDGRSYRDYRREEIFLPLGMEDSWVSMPPERHAAYGDRINEMAFFAADPEGGGWQTGDAWGTVEGCAVPRPGGNGYGPMRELARLYEMLLGGGERLGVRVLSKESAALVSRRHTEGLPDRTFGSVPFDRGLGVVLNSRRHGPAFSWYGTRASARAFGHQGYFSSVAFADPEHDLVVALVFNGVRESPVNAQRIVEAIDALYEDLGL